MSEFPSMSIVGINLSNFGNIPKKYEANTTPPVQASTPVFVFVSVEKITVRATTNNPNSYIKTIEYIRF